MAIKEVTVQGELIRFGAAHVTAAMPGLALVVRDLFVQNHMSECYVAEVRDAIMGFDGSETTPGARYNELMRTFTDGVEIGGKLFIIEDEGKKKMYAKTKKIIMRDGALSGDIVRSKPVLRQWAPSSPSVAVASAPAPVNTVGYGQNSNSGFAELQAKQDAVEAAFAVVLKRFDKISADIVEESINLSDRIERLEVKATEPLKLDFSELESRVNAGLAENLEAAKAIVTEPLALVGSTIRTMLHRIEELEKIKELS